MNRKEAYAKIKELNLVEKIKEVYGCNYTNVSTASLIDVINKATAPKKPTATKKSVVAPVTTKTTKTTDDGKLTKLIKVLYDKHILCKSEYESLK